MIDKATTRLIQDRALLALQTAFAADPMFRHIKIALGGGRTSPFQATLDFTFMDTSYVAPAPTEISVASGRLAPGTVVNYGGKRYTIIKARNTRYLVACESTGKQYTLPFHGISMGQVVQPSTVVADEMAKLGAAVFNSP